MKLRNKRTGEIVERSSIITLRYKISSSSSSLVEAEEFGSIEQLNEEWEDYKTAEPLIKDEKIRKALRAWAEIHEIKEVFYCKYSWKNNTAWIEDADDGISMVKGDSVSIDIPVINGLKNREFYTIAELCGELDCEPYKLPEGWH